MADENAGEVQRSSSAIQVEPIPDEATVTRLIDCPRMYEDASGLIWTTTFEFPQSAGESVNWDKYAPPPDAVHKLGLDREEAKRASRPEFRYAGYIPALARDVRGIKTARGHGFDIQHVPTEGIYHAEIHYASPEAVPLQKGDKGELKLALQRVFGELIRCPDEGVPGAGPTQNGT
ncbi:hypothetical protein [Ralstonia insidiosa]|uniref:Uncharacterized protein n=1 Tax=Ralstonia insidiosa TaxID=190721 RepID=A0A848P9E3_9RALS|nr:hypothetical protein [Ralstonia insidiosa]NMV41823.1 hypothetical protein [Ralstonia insidiosa]